VLASVERATVNALAPRPRTVLALALLAMFIILTGAEASVLRAGVMATLSLIGRWLGRTVSSKRMLLATVIVMVLITPTMPTNLGFLLSALATLGILEWAEPFERFLRVVPGALGIRSALATTIAAQVFTTPLLLAKFGTISLISPVVNIFVLPIVPLAMAAGALTVLLSWIPLLGQAVAWLAWLPHSAIVRCILWCAEFPVASIGLPTTWWWPFAAAGLGLLLFRHVRHSA
jgi:competence protein ComEC